MIIKNKATKRGFITNIYHAGVEFPKNTWQELDSRQKQAVIDNLLYLKLFPFSIFMEKDMIFESDFPYLKRLGDECLKKDIPRIAAEDKKSSEDMIGRFRKKNPRFKTDKPKILGDIETEGSSLIGMSFGKDSLLSYGLAEELGLSPRLVMVQDFWDIEAKHKLDLIRKFRQEFKEPTEIILDDFDDLNDYKRINISGSDGIINANAMNSYMAVMLPLAITKRSRNIIFGNEHRFNDYYIDKEGYKVYPSYDQSSASMKKQNSALKGFTEDNVRILSLIEPLYNIAEVKVLFSRYKEIAKYQMSCGMMGSKSRKERWCYGCAMCAKAYLYMVATDNQPERINHKKSMFGKEKEDLYPLFNKNPERIYEKPKAARDEQLFAFYLAHKNDAKGYLMDKFRKIFLKEAIDREDELYKRFYGMNSSSSIPPNMKKRLKSILKEELGA